MRLFSQKEAFEIAGISRVDFCNDQRLGLMNGALFRPEGQWGAYRFKKRGTIWRYSFSHIVGLTLFAAMRKISRVPVLEAHLWSQELVDEIERLLPVLRVSDEPYLFIVFVEGPEKGKASHAYWRFAPNSSAHTLLAKIPYGDKPSGFTKGWFLVDAVQAVRSVERQILGESSSVPSVSRGWLRSEVAA